MECFSASQLKSDGDYQRSCYPTCDPYSIEFRCEEMTNVDKVNIVINYKSPHSV